MKLDRIALWEERDFFSDAAVVSENGGIGIVRGVISADDSSLHTEAVGVALDERTLRNKFSEVEVFLQTLDGGNLFRSLRDMTAYCRERVRDHVPYSFGRECWGFRVLDDETIWYLALTPWHEKRTFAAYGFIRSALMTHLAARRGLPENCYGTQPYTGERIHIRFGENGFESFPQFGTDKTANQSYAAQMNEPLCATPEQLAAMEGGSIYGWDTPAADVRNYDGNGKYIPPVTEPILKKGEKKKK